MTIDLRDNSLFTYLDNNHLKPALQKESGQLFIVWDIKGQEVPLFFVVRKESGLLQLVAYLPFALQKKTYGEVARMLHMLNRDLDMPGFGMDESENLMFYRAVIPAVDNKISTQLFDMYIKTTRLAVDTFIQAIAMIASGSTTVDEVLKRKKPNAS